MCALRVFVKNVQTKENNRIDTTNWRYTFWYRHLNHVNRSEIVLILLTQKASRLRSARGHAVDLISFGKSWSHWQISRIKISTKTSSFVYLLLPFCCAKNSLYNSTFAERSFSVYGPKRWNKLPTQIRNASSLTHSRHSLKLTCFSRLTNHSTLPQRLRTNSWFWRSTHDLWLIDWLISYRNPNAPSERRSAYLILEKLHWLNLAICIGLLSGTDWYSDFVTMSNNFK